MTSFSARDQPSGQVALNQNVLNPSPRQSFDHILGRRPALPADIGALYPHRFFYEKVDVVRAATSDAASPVFIAALAGCELRIFKPETLTDVIELLK
jgi:hypothetical protein